MLRPSFLLLAISLLAGMASPLPANDSQPAKSPYEALIEADAPVAWWRMTPTADGKTVPSSTETKLDASLVSNVKLKQVGPRPSDYPLFDKDNLAGSWAGNKGFLRVKDPGDDSSLDFDKGDAITLEAWVNPFGLKENQQIYVVGKGRTNNAGFPRENQNYALRLRGEQGTARLSFLFRTAGEGKADGEYHRWNSRLGLEVDSGWHHVAVTYVFGEPESIRGYLDGKEVTGTWDYAGATAKPPVVDNDELWIGSSMGGSGDATFIGLIDEVAIYRAALSAERLKQRYVFAGKPPEPEKVDLAALPKDAVLVQVFEGSPERSWNVRHATRTTEFTLPAVATTQIPHKYNARGVIDDRSNPYVVRMDLARELPAGKYRFLVRSLNAGRLMIDGKLAAQTDYLSRNAGGHEKVPDLTAADPHLRPLPQGHSEKIATVELEEGVHHFRFEALVGGAGVRLEAGQPCVGIAVGDGYFELLAPAAAAAIPLDDAGWAQYAATLGDQLDRINAEQRRLASVDEQKYWDQRHELARKQIAELPPVAVPPPAEGYAANNAIDHFLNAKLAATKQETTSLTSDLAFLRRLSLDCRGTLPTRAEIKQFLADEPQTRRTKAIERMLQGEGWADNWVGYWQDVLAENPGLVKPTLNNTGPFRTWIYESLADNKPLDRFATELVMMEGSKYYGGPAGFGIATENDAPLAEKANVLAKAFLGQEMKCARCHDAPSHPFEQRDLFSLAAMLSRQTLTLPKTSTVPPLPGGRKPLIKIVLKPGDKIAPVWPFDDLADDELPNGVLRRDSDPRERLAALITLPQNERFAKVAVNRLWKRLIGWGLVDPVDDWSSEEPSHPELLVWLSRELMTHDYDLKHVAALIFASHLYQREPFGEAGGYLSASERLFAGPARRRMTAEQVIDAAFQVAGKPLAAEPLTLDPEGRLDVTAFLNLGAAKRAWQFTSISTDRDRPALTLPRVQAFLDVLTSFGWRDYRPSPITERDETPNPLQPLALANGIAATSVCRLSDGGELTELALQEQSVSELVDTLYLQVLSRQPSATERARFVDLLEPGFSERRTGAAAAPPARVRRHTVSWSNHLSPEATLVKLEMEREVRAGDPPTRRLTTEWRERMEDAVWALVNSPEFVWLP
jgi:hypothetical protein